MGSPPKGWAKLNFDGASKGNPGKARIGCIIRSDSSQWLIKRAKPLGIASNNIAKLEALQEGLQLGLRNKISR